MATFTLTHVLISLIGILSGFVVLFGLLASDRMGGWTKTFLIFTVATSVTGFFFPFHGFTPAIGVGIISLVALGIAIYARYARGMEGGWRRAFVIGAVLSQYFNVFVLVVQSFQKIPALRELAPTQTEPPFQIAQGITLLLFVGLGILATKRFRPGPPHTTAIGTRSRHA